MNRIATFMVMHSRDRMSWFLIPASVLGTGFVIVLFIALSIALLWGGTTPVYTGALAVFYFVMLIEAIGAIFGWLAQQSAATLGLWLVPLIACFALVCYALLRKATV